MPLPSLTQEYPEQKNALAIAADTGLAAKACAV